MLITLNIDKKIRKSNHVIMPIKKVGLLIVDVQLGFSPSKELIDRIIKTAESYEHVAMTRFTNKNTSLYRKVLGWNGDGGSLVFNVQRAVILDKDGYGLTATHLNILKNMKCDEWHLCGLETNACVLACAFSLWDAGIHPIILPELCESPLHVEGLKIAQRQFGYYVF